MSVQAARAPCVEYGALDSYFMMKSDKVDMSALRDWPTVCAIARTWIDQDAVVLLPRHGSNGEAVKLSPLPEIRKIPSPDALGRVKLSAMETITRQVGELQANERSAAELLLGHRLRGNEQLILQVRELDVAKPTVQDSRPAQTLDDWTHVYDGLSDTEIEKIDAIAKTRANLTRDLP